jgi:thioredoxin reductase (NADPH)
MYDIAIIGAGPAGLSAAITARARDKQVLVISNKPQENPLAKSQLVDNYPGLPGVGGLQLLEQMLAHADKLGTHFTYARVISVLPMGTHFSITTSDEIAEARAVILAVGAQRSKPIAGEQEFLGRGVSYCATCDGMLYRTSTVAVVGLNSDAVEEANFLAEIGAKVIFLAPTAPQGLREEIFVQEGHPLEIKGDLMGVTELVFREKGTDAEITLPVNGIFILRDSIAPSTLIAGLKLAEGASAIAVDAQMRTSVPGVFAAGDCTGAPLQVAKAAGQGQVAVFSTVEWLGSN